MSTNFKLMKEASLVGDSWIDSGDKITVLNPANGETIGSVPKLGVPETKRAIDAAQASFQSFRKTTAQERSNWLSAWRDLILKNVEELAQILTLEQGKTLSEARGEVTFAAS